MEEERTRKGISTSILLFVVFLVLKLTDSIDWSWWWVTSPLWIGPALLILIILLIFIGYIIFKL